MTIENTQSSNTANAATTKSQTTPEVETTSSPKITEEQPQLEDLAEDAIISDASETDPSPEENTTTSLMSESEAAQLLIELSDAQERAAKFSEEKKLIYEQLMRRQAEFENFRKRVERERTEVNLQAKANVVIELLPVLDNLERALESAPKGDEVLFENILTGVKLIHRQFLDVLIGLGLSPIKAMGEAFDPHIHEAVTTEANNELPENTVIAELQKGYKLGEKLLRPAMVKVSVRG
ncbi:MAG: nucleotide exchange factor GrpE [Acidobacteria bacterium]|nr:nucleotide exchange factor GrpE [Acidobacteriota bacterium]